jgi:hypothetical protein
VGSAGHRGSGAGAKQRGLPVIGVVSKAHCEQSVPAHSSGKKLIDVADVILDNQCPPGDCVVEMEGLEWRTGPTSTVTGGMIINMLRCATAEKLLARGVKPTMLPSHQFVGNTSAAEQLDRFTKTIARACGTFMSENVRIAMLGSGFVAEFYMQGLANVNGQAVAVNYSRTAKRAKEFAKSGAFRKRRRTWRS